MSFWSRYSISFLLLDFLDDATLSEFACIHRQFHQDVKGALRIRKHNCVQRVMRFFHQPNTLIFSLHSAFQEGYEMNLRRLFSMQPEWFAYMEENQISYLDLDNPDYSSSAVRAEQFDAPHIVEGIMGFLERNCTLWYCNLGLFYSYLSRDRLLSIMQNHPNMYHLKMTSVPPNLIEPTSLYRRKNGRVEWRRYPPSLVN